MRTLVLTALTVTLCGCANIDPSVPQGYSGPLAAIQDSAVPQSDSFAHMFFVKTIDGRNILNSGDATVSTNRGRGRFMIALAKNHDVPARSSVLKLTAATLYAAPILTMTNPGCRVEGEVELAMQQGQTYIVRGTISRETCAVWVESSEGKILTPKVSGPGLK